MAKPQVRRRRIGPLDCMEIVGEPSAPTIILLHGYGADANDLVPLGQIPVGKGVNWVFPNGHQKVMVGPHQEGKAWFPISVSALEKAMTEGEALDMSLIRPPGLERARDGIFDLIEKLGTPMDKIIIGGFSQGAMVAVDVSLNSFVAPRGLVILSGTLVDSETWTAKAPRKAGLEFFQAHGVNDPVLSCAGAEKLEGVLVKAGLKGKLQKFQGQHEIPSEVLIQLTSFLRKMVTK